MADASNLGKKGQQIKKYFLCKSDSYLQRKANPRSQRLFTSRKDFLGRCSDKEDRTLGHFSWAICEELVMKAGTENKWRSFVWNLTALFWLEKAFYWNIISLTIATREGLDFGLSDELMKLIFWSWLFCSFLTLKFWSLTFKVHRKTGLLASQNSRGISSSEMATFWRQSLQTLSEAKHIFGTLCTSLWLLLLAYFATDLATATDLEVLAIADMSTSSLLLAINWQSWMTIFAYQSLQYLKSFKHIEHYLKMNRVDKFKQIICKSMLAELKLDEFMFW